MTYIACNRGGGNSGSQKFKLVIPIDQAGDMAGDGRKVIQTEKAYGFMVNDQKIWMPKSQVDDFHYRSSEHENHFEFWCPRWLIEKNGLEIFIDTSEEPGLFD